MKRPGQPVELATAYVTLADQLSSYLSGATIAVTGGKPFKSRPHRLGAAKTPFSLEPDSRVLVAGIGSGGVRRLGVDTLSKRRWY